MSERTNQARIAGFQLERRLGAGGMGVVYLAEDTKLHRPVALKVLTGSVDDAERTRQRFLREARSAAALNHPNICTIYRVGEVEESGGVQLDDRHVPQGTPFIAMELIEGETLDAVLKRSGPLPVPQLLDVARQVASGLEEAHRRGIVHRDLKPGNVMLDRSGRVKILDFGLARPVAPVDVGHDAETASHHVDATVTREGTILGTVGYMSPEQLEGNPLDTRSDMFSLGVLLFELATGRRPFEGTSPASVVARVLEAEPQRPQELRPDLPDGFERLLLACLRKTAVDRPSIRDLLSAMEGTLASLAVPWTPPGRPRRRWVQAGLAAALALIALALSGRWLVGQRSAPPRTGELQVVAVLPLVNESEFPEDSDYLSAGIARSLIRRLDTIGLPVIPWTTVTRFAGRADSPLLIARELRADKILAGAFRVGDDDDVYARLALVDGQTGLTEWSEEYAAAFSELVGIPRQMAVTVAGRLQPDLSDELLERLGKTESASAEAWDLYLQGAEALQHTGRDSTDVALAFFERALAIDPNLVEARIGAGAALSSRFWFGWGDLQDWHASEQFFLEAIRMQPYSMAARGGLTRLYWFQGHSERCLTQGREAANLGQPEALETLMTSAESYLFGGLPQRALPLLEKVIELDPWNAGAHWLRVAAATWAFRPDLVVEAAADFERRFGANPQVNMYLAGALYELGEVDAAERKYEAALESFASDPNLSIIMKAGWFFSRTGRAERAREVWQAGDLYVADLELNNTWTRYYRAMSYASTGNRRAFRREAAWFEENVPNWGRTVTYIGLGYVFLGDLETGAEYLLRGVRLGYLEDYNLRLILSASGTQFDDPRIQPVFDELDAARVRIADLY